MNELKSCIQCGTCTASCFSGRVTALNMRKIVMDYLSDERSVDVHDEIWFCLSCYACQERCPRGIKLTEIILKARQRITREKGLPGRLSSALNSLKKFGALVVAKEEHVKMRKSLGLPLYHVQFDEKARKEIEKLVEKYSEGVLI